MDDSKKYGYAGIPEDKTKYNDSGKGMRYNFSCHRAITFSSRFVRLYMHARISVPFVLLFGITLTKRPPLRTRVNNY